MTWARVAIVAATFVLVACGRLTDEALTNTRIRLVDHLAFARFDSAADRISGAERNSATTRTLVEATGTTIAGLDWARFEVDWKTLEAITPTTGASSFAKRVEPALRTSARGCEVDGSSVTLLSIATIGDRDHVVEVEFKPGVAVEAPASRDGIVVFELDPLFATRSIASADDLVLLFSREHGVHRFLSREGGRVEFRTAPETTAVVVAVVSLSGGSLLRVTTERRTRLGGVLEHPMSIAGDPRAQRVLIGDERRESLILAAPGSVRFEMQMPRAAARLRAAIAPIDWIGSDAVAPTVNVRLQCGSERLGSTVALSPETWTDVEVDLTRCAGKVATIEFGSSGRAEGGLFGIAVGSPVIESANHEAGKDIILISLDTLRYDRTSLSGYPVPTTPRLAALGAESAVFHLAFAPAAYTLPSHATIFSGRLPDAHRVNESSSRYDAADDALLAAGFRAAGYVTAGFTAGGYVRPEFGLARGFERYRLDDPGRPEWREEDGPFTGLTNESLRQLERFLAIEHGAPLFVFVHTYAAHDYWAPRELIERLGPESVSAWDGLDAYEFARLRGKARSGESDPDLPRRISAMYDAGARLADETLGRVLDLLETSHRLRDALVFVVSDHGEELFERGRIGHGFSTFDEMLRVPFVVRGPGIEPGAHSLVVSLADIAPTIREYARIPEPIVRADGRSLLPILGGGRLPDEGAYARILGDGDAAERALRGTRHKLRVAGDPFRPWSVVLHDLVRDPGEIADASLREPEVTVAMLEALRRRYREQTERPRTPIETVMSADTIRQLRELGYLEGNR